MKDPSPKVISFPSPVPSKAGYQPVKSSYTVKEIKQLFGLSEKTIRRWTEQGIIQASSPSQTPDFVYDFQALTQFRRVRELRAQGHSIRQIEAELQGQLNLFRVETSRLARLLTAFEEALLLHEQGDPKAAEHYVEAINEGDNVAEAYCNLGILNLERGQLAAALDNFTLSLKNDPRHVEAHYNLANLYYDAGDLQLAKLHYEAAAAIEPGFSLVYFNLSLVYHKLGELEAASATLEKYRQLEPEDEDLEVLNQLLKAMKSPSPFNQKLD
ncbi:MAG TPA: tetratricopeptide repeat protein [Pyrinomonadaceae bacterium]|jgi:tetratricopeptide (TPR) repeat protein|nr:tetratricopeptide repeat protein [Pyrinomonadaceae bacterium]